LLCQVHNSAYYYSQPIIINSVFRSNSSASRGGAIYAYTNCSTTVANCSFYGNTSASYGKALCNQTSCSASIKNSILWDTSGAASEIYNYSGCSATATYSDVRGGYSGSGNINSDPKYVDPSNGNMSLQSSSPCIDSGDGDAAPAKDKDGNSRYDAPNVSNTGTGTPNYSDMGAYEYTGY
jgi:predicted outer membrane repeat protein